MYVYLHNCFAKKIKQNENYPSFIIMLLITHNSNDVNTGKVRMVKVMK